MKHRIKVDKGGLRLPNTCLMQGLPQKSSASQNNSRTKTTTNAGWRTPEKNEGYPLGSKQNKDPEAPQHAKTEDAAYSVISAAGLDTNLHNVTPFITNVPLHVNTSPGNKIMILARYCLKKHRDFLRHTWAQELLQHHNVFTKSQL